ncbi:MAG: alpha/beta fold hydrolase [bacterium]|nr:alpha/beta fold hydrolase [bacterium]MDZ4285943.1 alpha/beta fold hydrolase [Candidatus Sungbacteria bacterium]
MIPASLANIKTRDGIVLEGIAILPRRKTKTALIPHSGTGDAKRLALIWLHGLSSRFSSGQKMIHELSSACNSAGMGYFKFNMRGHDIATRAGDTMTGAGFERFEDCAHDIRAMIRFARAQGFTDIILAGHSTGANKAVYYTATAKDKSVKGLVLLGAISDIVAFQKQMGKKKFANACAIAKRLRKNPRALMPIEYGLFSARRFWSLCNPGEREDTFPYYDAKRKWVSFESINVPMQVIIGNHDEHLDRKPADYLAIFEHHALLTKNFRGVIIKSANHGFKRKEKEVAEAVVAWIKMQNRIYTSGSSPSIGEVRRGSILHQDLPPLTPPILGGEKR